MKKLEFIKRFKYFKNRNELVSWIYLTFLIIRI